LIELALKCMRGGEPAVRFREIAIDIQRLLKRLLRTGRILGDDFGPAE